jgi:hypothetical protein
VVGSCKAVGGLPSQGVPDNEGDAVTTGVSNVDEVEAAGATHAVITNMDAARQSIHLGGVGHGARSAAGMPRSYDGVAPVS